MPIAGTWVAAHHGVGIVVAVIAAFALVVVWLNRASSDGIPSEPIENEDLVMLDRPRRVPTEVLRRLARGSIAPPNFTASIIPARTRFGELQTRRLGTPMPTHDDGWDLVEGE